jgi:putative ABC transport system permease protein
MTSDVPGRGERWYRLLIRLYPRAFRARYTHDLIDFYRERVARVETPRELVAVWLRVIPDLLSTAAAERANTMFGRARVRTSSISFTPPPEDPMSVFLQDLRFALRGMRQRPAFTAVVLATLALGIGANAAIFSVVDAVLLRPLPYANVDRIVRLTHDAPYQTVSEPEFIDYQRDVKALSALAAFNSGQVTVTVSDEPNGEPIRAASSRVSQDFFSILGARAAVGRLFSPEEYAPSAKGGLVVISNGLWRQQFAADRGVIGKKVELNGRRATIIGVLPEGFSYPNAETAFWAPWRLNRDSLWTRNNHYLGLVGLLAPNATLAQANVQVRALESRWMHDFPETYFPDRPLVGHVASLRDAILGPTRPYLLALLGAVGFILLIACVNVANLLLVRGDARRKEFAIRTALGASSHRLVRQMLTESSLFACFGAALGIGLAVVGSRALVALAPGDLPRLDQVSVDYRVIAFTVAITLVTGLLFGLVPAIRELRHDSADGLREGSKSTATSASRAARRALVITEVALAVVMCAGAGLLIRSLAKLRAIDLGFDTSNVLTLRLTLPPRGYNDTTADAVFRDITTRVGRLPGVRAAALDGVLPISGPESEWSIMIDGHVVKTIAEAPSAKPEQISPDYFKTFGIRVLRGRTFTDADRMGAPPVAVINEAMAKKLWPGIDPVGHTLKMFNDKSPWVTIVGLVANVRARGIQEETPATMYFPYSQSGASAYYMPSEMTLVVKTVGDPALIGPSVRSTIRSLDPRLVISQVKTMDVVVTDSISSRRFTTLLLGAFATLALGLAGIGIYGVIAYGVSQRAFETGVRIALGATRRSVIQLVMSEGARLTAAGIAIGLGGAFVVDRALRSLLVDVSTFDPITIVGVVATLLVVAALACAVPARRATAVSPTDALRNG